MKPITQLFFVFVLFAHSLAFSAQPDIQCRTLFLDISTSSEASNLLKYLVGPGADPVGTSESSVVKATGHRKGKVVFLKDKDARWVSRKDAIENTLTAEGDIRLPIFLFGTTLAAKLGFAIREVGNNRLEIEVPDAETLAHKVALINQNLKAKGKEPITYLPVRTGFVTIKETIQILLSAKDDFLVHFPYADHDLPLVPHEVSFHLGSILLSKKINERSREITVETQRFIDLIDAHRAEFDETAARFKGQIRNERNFEMDAGLASMVTSPGFTRRDHGMKSYTELLPLISERYYKYMVRNIEYMTRPRLQPYEAVLARLQLITGMDLSEFIKADTSTFLAHSLADHRVGIGVELDAHEKLLIKKIVAEFVKEPRSVRETGTPEAWLQEYLTSLDQRIQDIIDAIP